MWDRSRMRPKFGYFVLIFCGYGCGQVGLADQAFLVHVDVEGLQLEPETVFLTVLTELLEGFQKLLHPLVLQTFSRMGAGQHRHARCPQISRLLDTFFDCGDGLLPVLFAERVDVEFVRQEPGVGDIRGDHVTCFQHLLYLLANLVILDVGNLDGGEEIVPEDLFQGLRDRTFSFSHLREGHKMECPDIHVLVPRVNHDHRSFRTDLKKTGFVEWFTFSQSTPAGSSGPQCVGRSVQAINSRGLTYHKTPGLQGQSVSGGSSCINPPPVIASASTAGQPSPIAQG